MMINFHAAFLSFPPSNTDSFVSTLFSGIRFSISERVRLNGMPASVDGRRRIDPVGEEGIDEGGVVPSRLVKDEPKKDELGRAGDGGDMSIELDKLRGALEDD